MFLSSAEEKPSLKADSSPGPALGSRSVSPSSASSPEPVTQPSSVCCDGQQFGYPPVRTDFAGGDPQILLSVPALVAAHGLGLAPLVPSTEPLAQTLTEVQFEPTLLVGPGSEDLASVLAQISDGGSLKPTKSLLRRGFLNPVPVDSGSASGGLPRLEISPGFVTEGLQASEPLSVLSSKPLQPYSRKLRGSRFLRMDDRLIAEAISSFSAPLASSGVVTGLVNQSSELLDSEEEDDDF
jgi:hypothetical protein